MVRSGTIKTLVALVAAMTIVSGVLILMETDPARPTVPLPLQAVTGNAEAGEWAVIRATDVPLQYIMWRNIVVHDVARDGQKPVRGCHFLIGAADAGADGVVEPTSLWRNQREGDHIHVPGYSFNDNSIGICLLHDAGRSSPTEVQFAALVKLVRALQVTFQIPCDHVYLHSDLGEADCPGRFFPAETFRANLRRSSG